jgi:pSer/pThr/pTyr-binding forkhead associated (FHA) protein
MDGILIVLWLLRILFLGLLYVFLYRVVRALLRDLGAATRERASEIGRLVVVASPGGEPPPGSAISLDAITTLGRDVNNSIVVDDPFASAEHAILTFRGRGWYLEDLGSTNGSFINGSPVEGVAPLTFGDEIQIGQVRLRLERARR